MKTVDSLDKKFYSTDNDQSTEIDDFEEKFKVYSKPTTIKVHSIYLSETVDNNFAYADLINQLRSFSNKDRVIVYLANYGGQCSTGFQLFNAIQQCKAEVEVVVDAPCYSMGAILALSGDSLELQPGSFLMFHNYTSWDMGKGTELLTAINHYHSYFHRHLKRVCSPFLTAKELDSLKLDNDVYISYDDKDLSKRIKRHFK